MAVPTPRSTAPTANQTNVSDIAVIADADGLRPHPGGDEPFASNAVRERACPQLHETPGGRVDGGERSRPFEAHVRCSKEQRKESPRHAIVQVVDEACLADARKIPIADRRVPENFHATFGRDSGPCEGVTPR